MVKKKLDFLKSINTERNKRTSFKKKYNKTLLLIWNDFLKNVKKKDSLKLKIAFMLAKNFKYNHDGSLNNDYFFHTLRIATMLLFLKKKRIKNDLLILALLHNCLETTKTDYKLLINLFGKKIINEIKILTVNRKKQWSRIYKNNYYKKINNSSKNARLVKIFDKLDNLFILNENPNQDIKNKYLDEIQRYIIPMIKINTCHDLDLPFCANIPHYTL